MVGSDAGMDGSWGYERDAQAKVERAPDRAMMGTGDPWQHRSQNMRCKTCMWFVPKLASGPTPPGLGYSLGRCRRHAPAIHGFPVVFVNDWCGDHRLDENKV
jgi:hypothetical protein